ncbi:hypothetical protein ACKI1S_46620 [Streptomyces galilaeus]|uniref:Uncharacterized protein n=1 Tax=Streptomyces galilaeus TaxID=33899 RepID=A0ABW9IYM1_STRGJ
MTDSHQVPGQLPLLPADPPRWGGPAAVTADPIVTSGRTEYTVRCDGAGGCGQRHRHTAPGIRTAPCGATYTVPESVSDTS